jgi:glyoxylase-like metal-dependent hydrolase (beta-lactamase superfamily II)
MMTANFAGAERVFKPIMKDVTLYEWDREVAPGVVAVGAPGHTPGHTMFAIASGSTHFMAVSDITNNTALFVRNPDWAVMFDTDPEMARVTRHRVLDMVAAEKMHVGFYHAPFPANGFITRDGQTRYHLVPQAWVSPV